MSQKGSVHIFIAIIGMILTVLIGVFVWDNYNKNHLISNQNKQQSPDKLQPNANGADLNFIPDPGVRMQNASNPGIFQDQNGLFYLYYQDMVVTSSNGLKFSNGVPVNDTNDFRALKLPDGTYRRYFWDERGRTPSNVYGLKSKSSKDGIHFTQDPGYRYLLDESDHGKAGIHAFFVDNSGGVVLLYIGDLLGENNIRRAYSKDNGWTFNFEKGNILGDANDGKPGSFIDHKVISQDDGRKRLFTVRQGNIYSFISDDDGKNFVQEPGLRLTPSDFKEFDIMGFGDPVFIKLPDGRWRLYTTAFLKGYKPELGGSEKEIIVSATSPN